MEKEYTFILPCLNEEKTLEYCIKEIQKTIEEKNLDAEILVSDNGSTDNSIKIAEKNGVRVVICKEKGYGSALINGTNNAKGKYCIMGDSDGSYDFYNIDDFIKKLKLSHKGMEYASEMIIIAKLNNLKIVEVPTKLKKDLRDRKSHLKTIRDGWKHLKLIFKLAINKKQYIIEETKND